MNISYYIKKESKKDEKGSPHKSYLSKLDAIRGLAILGVFLFHFYVQVFNIGNFNWQFIEAGLQAQQPLALYTFYIFSYGWIGVSIFFVLSGFVNHWSYLNARKFSLKSFFVRRFWRIYPPYLIALLYFAFIHWGGRISTEGVRDFIAHIFLVHNFNPDYIFGFNNSFWSIAVEVQFYLLYPLVLFLRSFIGLRRTLLVALILSITIRVLVVTIQDPRALDSLAVSEFTLISWFDWILGAYLAEQYYYGKPAFPVTKIWTASLIIIFIVSTSFQMTFPIASSIAALATAIFLERYITSEYTLPIFLSSWLAPLGLCSYSFYLWHEPFIGRMLFFLRQVGLPGNNLATFSIGLLVVFGIFFVASWCFYKTVEAWSVKLGKHLKKLSYDASRRTIKNDL
jgi:peptidoglycan/LPS O-acetylase OafA/YrhL